VNAVTSGTIAPLAVSIGEPAGIGPEIIAKAWLLRRSANLPAFIVLGDPDLLVERAKRIDLDIPITVCEPEAAGSYFGETLPVLPLSESMVCEPGKPQMPNGPLVIEAITRCVELAMAGQASAVVTAPINKKALYNCGFGFPGHTEYLAALAEKLTAKPARSVMMLAGPELRTIPATVHIPLIEVTNHLSMKLIVETARIADHDLKTRFGVERPVIAIAGLNPHSGEDGAMGLEEIETIAPAIEQLRNDGIDARGPLPADTMFHERARRGYDVAICMYHDQALIPAKTIAFDEAVNVTLGLPFIRTSPDHGTAFDIAGTGKAEASSLVAAIRIAGDMVRHQDKAAAEERA
jgi:4-hydroxythreonine-4-phosphate dehydrogenase